MKIFKKYFFLIISLTGLLLIPAMGTMAEEPVYPGYPFVFDMTGKIDRISSEQLVVEDDLFNLSRATTFHAPDTIFTKSSAFQKGDFIGLVLKDRKSVV